MIGPSILKHSPLFYTANKITSYVYTDVKKRDILLIVVVGWRHSDFCEDSCDRPWDTTPAANMVEHEVESRSLIVRYSSYYGTYNMKKVLSKSHHRHRTDTYIAMTA